MAETAAELFRMIEGVRAQRAILDRKEGELLGRLSALMHAPAAAAELPDPMSDLVKPWAAQREFELSKTTLRRLGQKHPIGSPGGFCFVDQNGACWYSKSWLRAHLEQHPVRRRRANHGRTR